MDGVDVVDVVAGAVGCCWADDAEAVKVDGASSACVWESMVIPRALKIQRNRVAVLVVGSRVVARGRRATLAAARQNGGGGAGRAW